MQISHARILVVDDEPSVLATLSAVLAMEGYEVASVSDGEQALEQLRDRNFDLVLSDLRMPKVEGLELVKYVATHCPHTVSVIMTGYATLETAITAVNLGAFDYLMKPIEIESLKMSVRRALERKRFSEIDALYLLTSELMSASDVRTVQRTVSETGRNVLRLAHMGVVPVDGGKPDFLCDGLTELFLRDSSVQQRLAQGKIVSVTAGEGALVRSLALVPGMVGNELACVISAHNGGEAFEFHGAALRFLEGLANQAALSLANLALLAEMANKNAALAAANARLQELDRFKSDFLSIASHELKAPVSVILGYNVMLAEQIGAQLPEKYREMLDRSAESCRRLLGLVRSLLDLNQLETGKLPVRRVAGDLRSAVQGAVSIFHFEAKTRGVEIALDLPQQAMAANFDPERMDQVLTNILGNALKYTPRGGRIRISMTDEAEHFAISVADTGKGISAIDQKRLFQQFVRGEGAGSMAEGSGLGLHIAKKLIEAQGGRIELTSAPGRGTCVTLRLPTMPARSKAKAA